MAHNDRSNRTHVKVNEVNRTQVTMTEARQHRSLGLRSDNIGCNTIQNTLFCKCCRVWQLGRGWLLCLIIKLNSNTHSRSQLTVTEVKQNTGHSKLGQLNTGYCDFKLNSRSLSSVTLYRVHLSANAVGMCLTISVNSNRQSKPQLVVPEVKQTTGNHD